METNPPCGILHQIPEQKNLRLKHRAFPWLHLKFFRRDMAGASIFGPDKLRLKLFQFEETSIIFYIELRGR